MLHSPTHGKTSLTRDAAAIIVIIPASILPAGQEEMEKGPLPLIRGPALQLGDHQQDHLWFPLWTGSCYLALQILDGVTSGKDSGIPRENEQSELLPVLATSPGFLPWVLSFRLTPTFGATSYPRGFHRPLLSWAFFLPGPSALHSTLFRAGVVQLRCHLCRQRPGSCSAPMPVFSPSPRLALPSGTMLMQPHTHLCQELGLIPTLAFKQP